MVMKKLINYIAQQVWNEVGVTLNEGITNEESLKATYKVVSEIIGEELAEQLIKNLLEAEEEDKKVDSKKDDTSEESVEDEPDFDSDDQKNMMTQAERDALSESLKEEVLINLGQILSEASIYDNKYAVGDKFIPLKNTADLFKMGLPPSTRIPKGPFTKIAPTDDGIEVKINNGKTVYVSAEDTGKNYIITASEKNIQSLFGKMKKGASATDINFDTDTMETAQCMGTYVNGFSILKQLNAATEETLPKVTNDVKQKFIKALGMSGDYGKPNEILSKLDTMPLGDYFLIAQLMAGMTKFTDDLNFKGAYITHKSIKAYYKATERSELVDGVKDNTADCVISNVPSSELVSKLGEGLPVEYDNTGVCTIIGTNIKFVQVSLKKAEGGAQLGKIYGFLKDKYNLLDASDVKKLALESVQLDEGIRDFLNKGANFIKSVGSKFLEKISQLGKFLSGFLKKMENGFRKSPKSAINKLEKELFKAGLHEGVLNEAKKPKIWDSFQEIGSNQKVLDKLISNVDNEMQSLVKASMSNEAFFFKGYQKLKLNAPVNKDTVAKLLTNFQSAIVLKSILGDLSGDAKALYSQMIELEKEMIYGKTTLPLYKVFGVDKDGKGTTYKQFPGSEKFVQDKLSKDLSDTVVFYLRANAQDNMYFTLSGYGLTGINETTGDLKYSQFRMGTNSTGRYSYNFEGTKELPLGKVKSALKI